MNSKYIIFTAVILLISGIVVTTANFMFPPEVKVKTSEPSSFSVCIRFPHLEMCKGEKK